MMTGIYTPVNNAVFPQFTNTFDWQPLLESDGVGYITAQEHVTPHIGVTSRFFGFNTSDDEEEWGSRYLDTPEYINRFNSIKARFRV